MICAPPNVLAGSSVQVPSQRTHAAVGAPARRRGPARSARASAAELSRRSGALAQLPHAADRHGEHRAVGADDDLLDGVLVAVSLVTVPSTRRYRPAPSMPGRRGQARRYDRGIASAGAAGRAARADGAGGVEGGRRRGRGGGLATLVAGGERAQGAGEAEAVHGGR
jgi:hypothetical protein